MKRPGIKTLHERMEKIFTIFTEKSWQIMSNQLSALILIPVILIPIASQQVRKRKI